MNDKKSWRDRAVPVTDKADAPKSSWRERAVPVEEESLWDAAKGNLAALVSKGEQMIPGSGIIDKIGAASYATQQEVGDLFRDDANKKDWKDRYQKVLDDQDVERKTLEDKYPVADTAGMAVGMVPNILIPTPGAAMKGAAGIATRVLGNTAISAADSATRNKDELIDLEAGQDAALLSGGISAGVEALPLVGKGLKAAKRMLPGTEDAYDFVNKGAAKLGSMVPGTDINSDELYELMKNKQGRLDARNASKNKNVGDRIFEGTAATFKELDNVTDKQATEIYETAEKNFIESIRPQEISDLYLAGKQIEKQTEVINKRPELFGRAKRVIDNVDEIIKRGDVSEIELPTANKMIDDLADEIGEKELSQLTAQRMLSARRYIDDVTKNTDFDKMLKSERDEILRARKFINEALDNTSSAKELREADKFYSEFAQQKKNAFNKLEVPLPAGGRDFTPEKMEQFFKSEAAQAKFIQREMDKFGELISKQSVEGAEITSTVNKVLNEAKGVFGMARQLEDLKRSSGGPSSQSINAAMQAFGAYASSGSSLLLLPITNPSAWMKLVDVLGETAASPFIQKITEASKEVMKKSPQLTTRLYLMGQEQNK